MMEKGHYTEPCSAIMAAAFSGNGKDSLIVMILNNQNVINFYDVHCLDYTRF